MDDKIVKIKKHIDQLAYAKENSPNKEKGGVSVSCDISGESNTIQNASKIEVNNHYHNKQAHIEKMLKGDDSALQQGRKIIEERKQGKKVEPENMTPKEYRNFKVGLWDGVERKVYRYDWTPFAWERLEPSKEPVRFVDKKPQKIERRQLERRMKPERIQFEERRTEKRRQQDKLDNITYYSCLAFSFAVLLTLTIGVIVKNTNIVGG